MILILILILKSEVPSNGSALAQNAHSQRRPERRGGAKRSATRGATLDSLRPRSILPQHRRAKGS